MIDISKLSPQELDRFLHLQALIDRQEERQETVKALRDYYYGNHPILLTQRQQEFLGPMIQQDAFKFAHNLVRSIVDTLRERLNVVGFTVNGTAAGDIEEGDIADPSAQVAALLWKWWNGNRLDSQQIRCHRRALRDGDTYAIVDYDAEKQMPRVTLHKCDDGQTGITFHRDPTDHNRTLFAARYFYSYNPLVQGATGIERKTVYLPAEIRKYAKRAAGDWEPYFDEEDNGIWPLPWRMLDGKPIGVAAIPFNNPGGSEMMQVIGLQNAVNKSWLDVLAAADTSGFPLMVTEYEPGGMPPEDNDDNLTGDDELRIAPGRMIETEGHVHRLEGSNLDPMLNVVWALVSAMSGVSRTPQYYLKPVGGSEVPSGESLKQLDSGLVKRAEERQLVFGQSWADVMEMCVKVERTFGTEVIPEVEYMNIATTWDSAEVRNDKADAETATIYKGLGMPDEFVWEKAGAEPDEIAKFKADARTQRAGEIATITDALRTSQVQQQQQPTVSNNNQQNGGNQNGSSDRTDQGQ